MTNPKGNVESLKPYEGKWRSGKTQTIRVPIALTEQILAYARGLDDNSSMSETTPKEPCFSRNGESRKVDVFFDNCCIWVQGGSVEKKELHQAYQKYCRNSLTMPMRKEKFQEEIASFFSTRNIYISVFQRHQFYVNIALIKEENHV